MDIRIVDFPDMAGLTATKYSAAKWIPNCQKALLLVAVQSVSGTTPTLVLDVESSVDGITFFRSGTLTEKDTQGDLTRLTVPTVEGKIQTAGNHIAEIDNLLPCVRIHATVGGTTPSFYCKIQLALYCG